MARNVVDEPSEDVVAKARADRDSRRNPFARIALFLRQVVNELKKVVTPTGKELRNYTLVVLVFVVIVMVIVSFLDLGFGWLVAFVFGDPAYFTG